LNKPRKKEPQLTEAEKEEVRRGQTMMQGLMSMAGSRPDSRASTHDGDGLPPRKKQAVESGSRTPSSPISGSRSGSAALVGRMQSGLRVSTPLSDSDTPSSPIGFGSSQGPQRVSLSRNGSSGITPFAAAVSTPDRTRNPGTGSSNESVLKPERLKNIFPRVPLAAIEDIVIRHGEESTVEIMKRLRAANDGVAYQRPGVATVKTIKPVATRAPVPLHPSGGSGTSFSSPIQIAALSQRKNPKAVSAIYANRSERKATQVVPPVGASSPAKSEVEEIKKPSQQERATTISDDEAVTEDDSDVEGARKGKGKMQVDEDGQDMDEVKALEVFNTCTAETLTGTIGKCLR
jgi:hypothetical protein